MATSSTTTTATGSTIPSRPPRTATLAPPPRLGRAWPSIGRSARSLVAALAVLVVFAELMLYGGDRREVALAFVLVQALGLCLLLVLTRWAPAELRRRRALLPLYLMFAGLVAWIGFQFAPVGQ